MKSLRLIALLVVFITFILSTALACGISVSDLTVKVKGENNNQFYSDIAVSKNTDVSIRVAFTIDDVTGNDCPDNINAKAVISRFNNNTGQWENYKNASTKYQALSEDEMIFTWTNEFNTGSNSRYTEYKVTGQVMNANDVLEDSEATVAVVDNSCSGVNLIVNDVSIDEGVTAVKTFSIENTSDFEFDVDNLNLSFTNSLIRYSNVEYDNSIPARSTRTFEVTMEPNYVTSNSTTTARVSLLGTLDGENCSSSEIGTESFDITVRNTGSEDNSDYYDYYYGDYYSGNYYSNNSGNYYSRNSYCSDIQIQSNSIALEEGTSQTVSFGVRNNSTSRFEIIEVASASSGVILSNYYRDQYIYPNQVGTVVLKAEAPNVAATKDYINSLKIRGRFANGLTCAFNDLNTQFVATILDTTTNGTPNCSGFGITAPETQSVRTYGSVPFTINNFTNKRADIYVEGTVDAQPSIISLPSNSSISREINVAMNSRTGVIVLRPAIEGCTLGATTITLANTGENSNSQSEATTGSDDRGGLAGLFGFGFSTDTAGIVLVVIIVIVLLAGVIVGYRNSQAAGEETQKWVKK